MAMQAFQLFRLYRNDEAMKLAINYHFFILIKRQLLGKGGNPCAYVLARKQKGLALASDLVPYDISLKQELFGK